MKKLIITVVIMITALISKESINFINPNVSLQSIVDKYSKESNNTAILVLKSKGTKIYKASSGLADRKSHREIKKDDLFEIGSATKVFIGIAIFQLIESGKLSLDTKLKTFYPNGNITKLANYKGKNYWDEVTIAMLLQHTSGFIDYLNVYGDDAKAIKILGGKNKEYTFDELIEDAINFGDANFKAGEKFKYCNTGYIILGDIISKVSHMDWHDYIQKNIFDVVGMNHTYFGTQLSKELSETMPKGYMSFKETHMPLSLASSAGEIISNLDDLALLMRSWITGKLYKSPKTLEIQLTQGFHEQYKNLKYGYAIMGIDGFYGHGGQTFGFQSYITINPKTGDMYIIGTNDSQIGSMNLFMQLEGIEYR